MRTYVYRLYPTKAQERRLEETLETVRRFYNDCLEERKTAWETEKRNVYLRDQKLGIKTRRATNPYAAKVYHHIFQAAANDLDQAFQAFFRRVKRGEKPGYPRFKSRSRFKSFGLIQYNHGFKIDGRRLRVTGIGRIAVRWHRPIEGRIKTLRVVRRADGWYAHLMCEVEPSAPFPVTGNRIGIDLGIASFLTTSDGEKVPNPAFHQRASKKLRRLHRSVDRKKKGGSNRKKAVKCLGRYYRKTVYQRRDYLNNLACRLVREHDLIALERLEIRNMVRSRIVSKSIQDVGWGYFAERLAVKAAYAGRQVVFVDPRNTSRACSQCGRQFENLTLKVRHVACSCGLSMDRDENAARNILKAALEQLERAGTPPLGANVGAVRPCVAQEAAPP